MMHPCYVRYIRVGDSVVIRDETLGALEYKVGSIVVWDGKLELRCTQRFNGDLKDFTFRDPEAMIIKVDSPLDEFLGGIDESRRPMEDILAVVKQVANRAPAEGSGVMTHLDYSRSLIDALRKVAEIAKENK